jgi:hypothetical protein
MDSDCRYEDDDGYEEGDALSPDRQRWLEILEGYRIPPDTWAAHMVWVNSGYSWREAEDYARQAQQAWEEFRAGLRSDWVV